MIVSMSFESKLESVNLIVVGARRWSASDTVFIDWLLPLFSLGLRERR